MARVHVTLQDDQDLSPEERQTIFSGDVTTTPLDNGNTLLLGPEQQEVSDQQVAALSALPMPEGVIGRGILWG